MCLSGLDARFLTEMVAMSDSFRSVSDAVARFFDNYLICLSRASVPEQQRQWTIKRVEAFIKAHSGRKIKSLTGPEVHGHLETPGHIALQGGNHFPLGLLNH